MNRDHSSLRRAVSRQVLLGTMLLLVLTAGLSQAKTLTYQGTLINQANWQGDFPTGAAFTLSVTLDLTDTDSFPANPEIGYFDGSVQEVRISIPSTGIDVVQSPDNGGTWRIDLGSALHEPTVESSLQFREGGEFWEISLNLYSRLDSPPNDDTLAQPFDTSDYRLIEVLVELPVTDDQGEDLGRGVAGIGWVRADPIQETLSPPPPVRQGGYQAIAGFGDSLSASRNQDLEPEDADYENYFEGGYTNGPVWLQYLSWLLGLEYREDLNYSQFGGIEVPDVDVLSEKPFDQSLGAVWDNSALLVGIFSLTDPSLTEAGRNFVERTFLLNVEVAYAVGVRDLLVLAPADISFAPNLSPFFDPAGALLVRQFVDDVSQDLNNFADDWFGNLFPGMRVSVVDTNVFLDEILDAPADFGFTNVADAFLGSADQGGQPASEFFGVPGAEGYFFWEGLSPTSKVHSHLADRVYNEVFNTGSSFDTSFKAGLVRLEDDQVSLYGVYAPVDEDVELRQSTTDPGGGSNALESFYNTDPNLFFILDRPVGDQAFFRFIGTGTP